MFAKAALVLGAFAATAFAQSQVLYFTHVPNPITDGEPAAITYSTNDTTTPVTIILRKGLSTDLQTIETLTSDATGSQYVWTPSKSLPNGNDYALQIEQGKGAAKQTNYYGPFVIQGASPSASMTSTKSGSSNSTMTGSMGSKPTNGTMSAGNSTMTSGNMTTSSSSMNSMSTTSMPASNSASSTTGAGFQSTATGASATSSGAASSDYNTGSSLALALGGIAAILCLS